MKFNDRYEITELVSTQQESTTFTARDLTTGTSVMLHVLSPQSVDEPSLLELARQHLGPSRRVLEVSEIKGKPFVVTGVVPNFQTLRQWLDSAKLDKPPDVKASEQMGEFTRRFRGSEQHLPSGPPPPSNTAPSEPSEFTRMFYKPKPVNRADRPITDPLPQATLPASPYSLPEPSWSTPVPETPPDNNWVPKIQWLDPNTNVTTVSESISRPPQPPPVQNSGPSEFTRFISKPRANSADSQKPSVPEAATAAAPPAPANPQLAKAPTTSAPVSYVPLILGFVVLLLIGAIVVLYFALRG